MPTYEFRCGDCGQISTQFASAADCPRSMACEFCGEQAKKIISRPSVKLSMTSKMDRLDPKYDAMVDKAMRSTPEAEPDRHLKKMKLPPTK